MKPLDSRTINLASHPFRRERATNVGLAAICAGLFCCLLVLTALILRSRAQASQLRGSIISGQTRLEQVQRQQARFANVLSKPANEDVFSTTVFLNEVIARRAVSWTQAFKDLGTILPNDMKLLAIRLPQVGGADAGGTNRVELTMDVGAERPDAVIGLLKRISASNLFGAPRVVSQTPPNQNDPLYRYRMTVAYAQKF
jgi:type IV pilus assembly protein PilN